MGKGEGKKSRSAFGRWKGEYLLYNGFAKMLDAVKLRLDNASRRVREGGSDGVTVMMVVSEIDRLCIDEAY
jgi:hypothetical protein